MFGQAGSPTRVVYVDMTLTRSKVEVKVMGLLNFPKIVIVIAGTPQEAVHAGGDDYQPPSGLSYFKCVYVAVL